jgi:hypothetical protein
MKILEEENEEIEVIIGEADSELIERLINIIKKEVKLVTK